MSKRPIVFFSDLKSVDRLKPGRGRTDYLRRLQYNSMFTKNMDCESSCNFLHHESVIGADESSSRTTLAYVRVDFSSPS